MIDAHVLVLLAAYNGAQHIEEQLESILNQADVNVRVLVRVDPSSDGTAEIVRKYEARDYRVELLHDGPPTCPAGAGPNFFRLIRAATLQADTTHVALADQDDIWYEGKLATATHALAMSDASGYSSDVDAWIEATGRVRPLVKSQPVTRWDHLFSSAGPGCTYVLTHAAFINLQSDIRNRFDEAILIDYHDWLIYAWVRQHGLKWILDSTRTMAYRQHAGNQIGANRGFRAALRRAHALESGWYLDQVLRIATFVGGSEEEPILAIRRGGILGRTMLLRRLRQLRRRRRDAVIAFLALVTNLSATRIAERRA